MPYCASRQSRRCCDDVDATVDLDVDLRMIQLRTAPTYIYKFIMSKSSYLIFERSDKLIPAKISLNVIQISSSPC